MSRKQKVSASLFLQQIAVFAALLLLVWPTWGQDGTSTAEGQRTYPNEIVFYGNFFRYVSAEDDWLKAQSVQGKQPPPRTDYASAIGLNRGQEERMLALIIDLQHRRAAQRKQFDEDYARFAIAQQTGVQPEPSTPRPSYAAWKAQDFDLLFQAWSQLRAALGDPDAAKVDAYVKREFFKGKAAPWSPAPPIANAPIPENVSYELFIHHVAAEDNRVTRELAEGKEGHRQTYSLAAHFPAEEEVPVRAILLEANHRLAENHEKYLSVGREFMRTNGVKAAQLQPPAELVQLAKQRETVLEETKQRLKQELGAESFGRLDQWVKAWYGSGSVVTYPKPGSSE